jgi:hypothetical protein
MELVRAPESEDPAWFVEIEPSGERGTSVLAWLPGEEGFVALEVLEACVRAAAAAGAHGEVTFLVAGEEEALRVELDGKRAQRHWLPARDVVTGAVARQVLEFHAWAEAVDETPSIERKAFRETELRFGLDALQDGSAQAEVLALLSAFADDAALERACEKLVDVPPPVPLASDAFPDAASVRALVKDHSPLARVYGVQILARVQPDRALDLALTLSRDGSRHVRASALHALGTIDDPRAVERLWNVSLEDRSEGWVARGELTTSPSAEVDVRVIRAFDLPALLPATYEAPSACWRSRPRARRRARSSAV